MQTKCTVMDQQTLSWYSAGHRLITQLAFSTRSIRRHSNSVMFSFVHSQPTRCPKVAKNSICRMGCQAMNMCLCLILLFAVPRWWGQKVIAIAAWVSMNSTCTLPSSLKSKYQTWGLRSKELALLSRIWADRSFSSLRTSLLKLAILLALKWVLKRADQKSAQLSAKKSGPLKINR